MLKIIKVYESEVVSDNNEIIIITIIYKTDLIT